MGELEAAEGVGSDAGAGVTPTEFAALMQSEVDNNTSDKGAWYLWRPDARQAITELMDHVGKLCVAIWLVRRDKVREYAADVGNCVMKIVEMFG